MPEAELRALFAALDVDGTGAVDAHEFAAALLAGGLEPEGRASEAVAARSFRALDRWGEDGGAGGGACRAIVVRKRRCAAERASAKPPRAPHNQPRDGKKRTTPHHTTTTNDTTPRMQRRQRLHHAPGPHARALAAAPGGV